MNTSEIFSLILFKPLTPSTNTEMPFLKVKVTKSCPKSVLFELLSKDIVMVKTNLDFYMVVNIHVLY